MPGYESRAIPPAQIAGGRTRCVHLRRRRRPVDLRLARRQSRQSRRIGARLSGVESDQARAELPLQRPYPARGECRDRAQSACPRKTPVERTPRGRADSRARLSRRRARSRAHRGRHRASAAIEQGAVERIRRAVSRQPPVAAARKSIARVARAVPVDRWDLVFRARRGQRCARLPAPAGQSRGRCGIPACGQRAAPRDRRDHAGKTR